MSNTKLKNGEAHKLPNDLREALSKSKTASAIWQDITSLARNEWICWNITVRTPETRAKHISRTVEDLEKGKRRPCCWYGCTHRKDKELSKTQKWILETKK